MFVWRGGFHPLRTKNSVQNLRIMFFFLLQVYLLDDRGRVQFTSLHKEEELRKGDDSPDFIHAFNGYAPAGDVTGDMVYVNFARVEDLR